MTTLEQKVYQKKFNARTNGLRFLLSVEEVEQLLEEAGIKPEDWCRERYCLARYNDSGDYELGNCRFITRSENLAERKCSEKQRLSSKRTVLSARKAFSNLPKERRIEIAKKAGLSSYPSNKLEEKEIVDRFLQIKHIDFGEYGSRAEAARTLKCSATHIRRLLVKWKALSLL